MKEQHKIDSIEKFCNWLSDRAVDNLYYKRKQTLNDYLYEYCQQLENDDTFEDEHETYEAMADHVTEVINFLTDIFDYKDLFIFR